MSRSPKRASRCYGPKSSRWLDVSRLLMLFEMFMQVDAGKLLIRVEASG